MPPLKRLIGFFLRALVIYVLLMLPWPGWREAYAAWYRAAAEVVLQSFAAEAAISVEPLTGSDPSRDTVIIADVWQLKKHVRVKFKTSCRYVGYTPKVVFAALVLATPIPWRRRLRALVLGLVILGVLAACELVGVVLYSHDWDPALTPFVFGPISQKVFALFYELFHLTPFARTAEAAVVWLVVTLRRRDWPALIDSRQPAHRTRTS
jgi:hypothetical protein